jgi:hemoglobin-like flavoprotein
MILDVELLRHSFDSVLLNEPAITKLFYHKFLEKHPELVPMFERTTPETQAKMLHDMLAAIIEHLEDPEWLTKHLGAMGARHVKYGVSDRMYRWMGECLIETLSEVSGEKWTQAMATAWTQAFATIAWIAEEGARKAKKAT